MNKFDEHDVRLLNIRIPNHKRKKFDIFCRSIDSNMSQEILRFIDFRLDGVKVDVHTKAASKSTGADEWKDPPTEI